MFPELKLGDGRQRGLRGALIYLHKFLLAFCCCRLLVQMEDDEGGLEFHASAGDLLREQPENQVSLRNLQHLATVLSTEVHTRGARTVFLTSCAQRAFFWSFCFTVSGA